MSRSLGTSADFQLSKEAIAAAKTAAAGIIFTWGIFLAIYLIWKPESVVFKGCFALFGILGPLMMLVSQTRALMRKRRYFLQGVDIRRYIPMFVHRGGLSLPTGDEIAYVAALASTEELIFLSCEKSLCKAAKEDFFEDLKKEVARIPIRDIEDVVVVSPKIDESDRIAHQISEFLVNQTLGRLLHASSTTVFFDVFIVVVVAGQPKRTLVFGVPNKLAGAPVFDNLTELLPERIADTFEILGTASEAVEALMVDEADPKAIKNAKRIAIEVLATKARGQSLAAQR